MKFSEHLSAHITPEWRKQYIQYETMKDMLYEAIEQAPSSEVADTEQLERYYERFDESFFQFADQELVKINTFFSEKLAEASRKFANMLSELNVSQDTELQPIQPVNARNRRRSSIYKPLAKVPGGMADRLQNRRGAVLIGYHGRKGTVLPPRKLHEIKLAFSEFYLSLILLQNYQTLNFTGFRKILKKHDKLLNVTRGLKWRSLHVETALFFTSKQVDHLIKETETVFTTKLEGGDRQKAMKRLRVPPLGETQNPWTTFRVGLFAGLVIVQLTVAIVAANFTNHRDDWEPALRMYRSLFLLILALFLVGINTYGWRSSGVNHVLIFELDPRNNLTHQQILEVAGFFAVVWSISLLCYMFSSQLHAPVFAHPLALVLFCTLYLLNPLRVLHYSARRWLLRVLFRIFTAPFHHVGFADFWLADQLNSLVTVLLDFEYLLCFYIMEVKWLGRTEGAGVCGSVRYGLRPIIACLPAWFRFAQCIRRYRDTRLLFPHIANAGKYSTTFFVTLFATLNHAYTEKNPDLVQNNAFFYLWIGMAVLSTVYTFTWDIKMDWGLFDKNRENRFLREEIVYAYKSYYYFAVIEDFVLRFAWTVSVSAGEGGHLNGQILVSILSSLEVFRRFVWNFFRLENEHVNNCGQFRAVRDISIAPLDTSDLVQLERMMDEEDGVVNRDFSEKRGRSLVSRNNKDMKVWMEEDDDE